MPFQTSLSELSTQKKIQTVLWCSLTSSSCEQQHSPTTLLGQDGRGLLVSGRCIHPITLTGKQLPQNCQIC